MRLGVLGGTFDPIHLGHLILAEEARDRLRLDRVLLAPAADPPHKDGRRVSPAEHRVRMVALAVADNPHLVLSRVDVDRPGPHFTLDMVRLLLAEHGPDTELFFLMGQDSLVDLPTWHRPRELMALCRLVAFSRPDVPLDWEALEAALPGVREQVILLPMPLLQISGTDLRQRVREGRTIRYQVPAAVEAYILAQGLYRPRGADAWDDDLQSD
ncbi:MAG: nicotinate-nucleotide adenylyltransferase [Caldilineales bacterium]|nr:nicotinate-nucleotide adenylyltransferase [Caldilineales bacterium]MDW8317096.1 nicotinate-nucleotide adenylyltransferase [Anaerolineae bacterium]